MWQSTLTSMVSSILLSKGMKRLLIILFAIVLLAGCQKESAVDTSATVTYTLVPDVKFDVKSEGESPIVSSSVNSLSCLVYHFKNGNYEYIPEMSLFVDIIDPFDIKVPVKLFKDQKYRLIFVAQHAIKSAQRTVSYAYTISDGIMSVNEMATITTGDQLEAFAYVDDEVCPSNSSESKRITLERIVSQVNLSTSTSKENLPTSLNVSVSGTPSSYDIVNNNYSDETTTLTFSNISVPGDEVSVSGNEYRRLSTLYFLGSNQIDLTLTRNTEDQESFTINKVNTKVNYKTNIAGNILPGNTQQVY